MRGANRLQSWVLLAFMGGFLALLGQLVWGDEGMLWLLASGVLLVAINPVLSPQLIMALYRARPIQAYQAPEIYQLVASLAKRAGLARAPTLYYLPSRLINSFAVGRSSSPHIAVTDGLLHGLSAREMRAVMAHEIAHIANDDLRVMQIADLFSRMTGLLSLFGKILLLLYLPLWALGTVAINWPAVALLIFAPSISALAQLALSRAREYDADQFAARLTGDPLGLAAALARLEQVDGRLLRRILMPGSDVSEPSLLRTHPPTEERIRRLAAMAEQQAAEHLPEAILSDLPRHEVRRPGRHWNGLWY